jgi:hypothetical protein
MRRLTKARSNQGRNPVALFLRANPEEETSRYANYTSYDQERKTSLWFWLLAVFASGAQEESIGKDTTE